MPDPTLLYALLLSHLICDFPLQSEFMARHKSPRESIAAAPWGYVMASHAGVHAAGVWLVTGSAFLAGCEFVCHFGIDLLKCAGLTNIHIDQMAHALCKSLWAVFYAAGIK